MAQPPAPIAFPEWTSQGVVEGVAEFSLTFPTAFSSGDPQNDEVPVVVLLPEARSGPVPVVVVLHYWGATDLKVERSLGAELARRGIAAVLVTLPYHLKRTLPGHRSGAMSVQPDPDRLIRTMVQSVQDVRRAVDWVQSRPEFDGGHVAVMGTSLGAIVGSLAFAVDPRLGSGAFVLGGADLAHMLWHSSRVVSARETMRKNGITEEGLRQMLASVEPLAYLPGAPGRPTYVVGAKHDTVIPPADTEKLIGALEDTHKLWLDTGHYGGVFVQRRVLRSVAEFFEATFAGTTFTPPKRVYAPTVRVGAIGASDSGVQVGAGLDLWRFDAQGRSFLSLWVTPRGPQVYLGFQVEKNLSIGAMGSLRGPAVGAVWSIVL